MALAKLRYQIGGDLPDVLKTAATYVDKRTITSQYKINPNAVIHVTNIMSEIYKQPYYSNSERVTYCSINNLMKVYGSALLDMSTCTKNIGPDVAYILDEYKTLKESTQMDSIIDTTTYWATANALPPEYKMAFFNGNKYLNLLDSHKNTLPYRCNLKYNDLKNAASIARSIVDEKAFVKDVNALSIILKTIAKDYLYTADIARDAGCKLC